MNELTPRQVKEAFVMINSIWPTFKFTDQLVRMWGKTLSKYGFTGDRLMGCIEEHAENCKFAPKLSEIIEMGRKKFPRPQVQRPLPSIEDVSEATQAKIKSGYIKALRLHESELKLEWVPKADTCESADGQLWGKLDYAMFVLSPQTVNKAIKEVMAGRTELGESKNGHFVSNIKQTIETLVEHAKMSDHMNLIRR